MQLTGDHQTLVRALAGELSKYAVKRVGVAVSGGSDSMALLCLLSALQKQGDLVVEAITVNHGLRPEAADEAKFVYENCARLGVPHAIAEWTGWNGAGNLQGAARLARYRLIAEWAERRQLDTVCLGHTQDDVAETLLMRLKRESGVDGLARMDERFLRNDVWFQRPMMELSRVELRRFLKDIRVDWKDDPSNKNEAFERVRMRRLLGSLEEAGLSQGALAAVAKNLSDAKEALGRAAYVFCVKYAKIEHGDLVINRAAFLNEGAELRRRILTMALDWVSPSEYPMRRAPLEELYLAIKEKRTFALNGCLSFVKEDSFRIGREYSAVRERVEHSPRWDRWVISGPWQMGMQLRALGEPSLSGLKNWRETAVPRQTLMASPAVWFHDELIAAPLAEPHEDWGLTLQRPKFPAEGAS